LEALNSYSAMSEDFDSLALLKAIKAIAFNFQSQKYKPNALNESKRRLYLLIQDKFTTCLGYLDRFQNSVDVIQHWLWWVNWKRSHDCERHTSRRRH
jgi:hypothetical protein